MRNKIEMGIVPITIVSDLYIGNGSICELVTDRNILTITQLGTSHYFHA